MAADSGSGEAAQLLAQLIARASQPGDEGIPHPARGSQRRRVAAYDQLVIRLATGIGLLVCAAAWLVGAYFTLSWLASLGLGWAAAAIAPIAGGVQGNGATATAPASGVAVLLWAVPLGITLAEIGFDPGRVRGVASRLLWGVFLLADATTTALGIYPVLASGMGTALLTAGLAALLGLVLALMPEKLARRLIRENLGGGR